MLNLPLCLSVCVCAGQREAFLSHSDQLPGSQQFNRCGFHTVHPGESHPERESRRKGEKETLCLKQGDRSEVTDQ